MLGRYTVIDNYISSPATLPNPFIALIDSHWMMVAIHWIYINQVHHKCENTKKAVDSLVSKGLKEKIEANVRELNFLPKQAQLPI